VEKTERRRRGQLDQLYSQYLKKVESGEVVNCIVSSLGKDKLSLEEIRGTCVSLLQAAPETVASGMYQACGWLASPAGQKYQPVALKAILDYYDGDKGLAWDMAFREEKIPLIVSMYKETLRCWAPTPFAQGRATVKDIDYNGIHIPKGITVIMNGQGANLDPTYYGPDAREYKPTRFIGDDSSLPHLAFGAGSRQCPAMNISNRMMYGLLVRTILAFELKEAPGHEDRKPHLNMRDFSNYYGLVNIPRGWDCLLVARDPDWLLSRSTESKKAE
jgi:phenylacetate 2-hydroxylase